MPIQIMIVEFHNRYGPNILHQIPGQIVNLNKQELLQYTFSSDLQIDSNKPVFSYTQKNIHGTPHYIITYRFILPDAYQRALLRRMVVLFLVEEEKVKNQIFEIKNILQQIQLVLYSIFYNIYQIDVNFSKEIYQHLLNSNQQDIQQILQDIYSQNFDKDQIYNELEELILSFQQIQNIDENQIDQSVKQIFQFNKADFNGKKLEYQENKIANIQLEYQNNKNDIQIELLKKLILQCQIYRNTYLIYREFNDIVQQSQINSIDIMLKLIVQKYSLNLKNQYLTQFYEKSSQIFYLQHPIYCLIDEKQTEQYSIYDIQNTNILFKPSFIFQFPINNKICEKYNQQIDKLIKERRRVTSVYDWFTILKSSNQLKFLVQIIIFSSNNLKIFVQDEQNQLIDLLMMIHVSLKQNPDKYLSKIFDTPKQINQAIQINEELRVIRVSSNISENQVKKIVRDNYGLYINGITYQIYVSDLVQIPQKAQIRFQQILNELQQISNSQQFQEQIDQIFGEQIAQNTAIILNNTT